MGGGEILRVSQPNRSPLHCIQRRTTAFSLRHASSSSLARASIRYPALYRSRKAPCSSKTRHYRRPDREATAARYVLRTFDALKDECAASVRHRQVFGPASREIRHHGNTKSPSRIWRHARGLRGMVQCLQSVRQASRQRILRETLKLHTGCRGGALFDGARGLFEINFGRRSGHEDRSAGG